MEALVLRSYLPRPYKEEIKVVGGNMALILKSCYWTNGVVNPCFLKFWLYHVLVLSYKTFQRKAMSWNNLSQLKCLFSLCYWQVISVTLAQFCIFMACHNQNMFVLLVCFVPVIKTDILIFWSFESVIITMSYGK